MSANQPHKPLHFAAFVQATSGHLTQGAWRRPEVGDFNDLDVWVDLAKTLERGKCDALFLADIHGVYDPYRGSRDKYVEIGLGIPNNDPATLASAIAYATEHLGIAFTSSVIQEHPFNFARKVSTLDHAGRGRIAWNIVTTQFVYSATNFGLADRPPHDERYEWADEYVDVVYKLWEGSWDDGAVIKDRVRGLCADPAKVHRIDHRGGRYSVAGPHLSSPSRQRTAVLFQAGASPRGRAFAGRHAESVIIATPSPEVAAKEAAETRAIAVANGRNPQDIKFFQSAEYLPRGHMPVEQDEHDEAAQSCTLEASL